MKASKKQASRLKRRLESFDRTVSKMKHPDGYHKPGSQNRHKAMPAGTR